ncbi:MAG: translation initiation factor IF-2 [Clostridia bacterium]|nr:translation initiation factor IF-2 [Clostridia bacterium]
MAQGSIKISQISKDFNLKTKDITDTFSKDIGIEKKSGATVDAVEFELFIEKLTLSHQIKNLDSYLSGESKISIKKEQKAEVKAEAPKATPKAEEKPEVKPAATREQVHKAPETEKPKTETPVKPSAKPELKERRPQAEQQKRPFDQTQKNGATQRTGNNNKPFANDRNRGFNNSSSFDPFAKKRENMNRQAEGFKRGPQGDVKRPQQQNAPLQTKPAEVKSSPSASQNTARPAQLAALEKQKQAELRAKQTATAAPSPAPEKKEQKAKAQKQQFKTITPGSSKEVKGGVNISSDYHTESVSKTRVVDTRISDVNLSKYDDRYNDQFYAIANGTDTKAQKQKLKKQDNKGQNAKSAKDKERAAQEKIKRLEAEKARKKQLEITVPDEITVGELAIRLKKTSADVIKKLMFMGEMKMVNDTIDYATAEIIADEFGAKVTKEIIVTKEEKLFTEAEDNAEDLIERAPVVCVMGHVDHGKTSILDAIRHTSVTRGEAGGITQAIGAYRVKAQGKDITFLDTPGHEAFTAMRMRGAKSTDIAILVVAADDGVMPQTVEAISHAKAAGIDIIVAINKMDKPQANPDNVLNQLTQYELVPEEWGGDVICVPVSAHTGMGIDSLLESVLLVAEVKELKANPKKRARGLVIESKLDKGRGPVATVLVQNGTLHQGDYVIVGNAVGRVRAMVDDKGKNVKEAGPAVPVEIVGLDDVPQAGDELNAVEDERMAKALAEERREKQRQEILNANARVSLDDIFNQMAEGTKTLNIIVKADVAGSAEAVKASLVKLSNEEVKVNVIHSAVGGITESDVMLATASNAIIVGFSVRPDKNALDSAERNGVDIRTHRIIYEIIDEVEAALKGMLDPTFKEVILGHAEVRQTIRVPNVGTIAGCYVKDGKISRSAKIRIVRDGIVIAEDEIQSLKRFKDDVRDVAEGYECGVGLNKFNDIKEGDMYEAFIMEEVKK